MKVPKITSTVLIAAISSSVVYAEYEDFFFWKLGHLDGPHTSSKALGISRDGHVAVGATLVVKVDHGTLISEKQNSPFRFRTFANNRVFSVALRY